MGRQQREARRRRSAKFALAISAGLASSFVCVSSATASRTVPAPSTAATIPPTDWPAYLDGPLHSSDNTAEKAITPANAADLKQEWAFTAGGGYLSSPTVADGDVYIGANNGWLYELRATTGALVGKVFLGTVNVTSCPPPPTGMVSTATVAIDPVTGQPTVYATGADGYLYALSASNLAVEWRSVVDIPSNTVNDYFDWSSPTVSNGRIYVGVSSNCDSPLVRGGLISYDQETGAKLGEFYTVPQGDIGGSVWSSLAVGADGDVYATTGNGPEGSASQQLVGDSESIIKLSPGLEFLGRFQVPMSDEGFDTDFGASPVLFDQYVGACNKNGIFYALDQSSMKLAWKAQVSGPGGGNTVCVSAAAWNGQHLYLGTPAVTIGSDSYTGSVQARDPDGQLVWATGLPNGVDGTPSLDGAGVLAVGTFDSQPTPNATYLLDAATGRILRNLVPGGDFAQSTFAENWLFTANENGVYAWGTGRAVTSTGDAHFYGSAGSLRLKRPIVGMARTPDGKGYWLVASDGGIFAYGDARFHGSAGTVHLNSPIVGMAATNDGKGYWLVAADGGIFAYGDAKFHGSAGGIHLNSPIVGMAATPEGGGYWLVAADGGMFAYGDARFHGSAGAVRLTSPIVGMAATPDGTGYWLVASDGGIFAYGDAKFHGSAGAIHLNSPIAGMAASPDGGGYWLVAADGGIFSYGDTHFYGSTGSLELKRPIVGVAATPDGRGYWLVAADGGIFAL